MRFRLLFGTSWVEAGLKQMYDTTSEALSRRFANSESNFFGFKPTCHRVLTVW